MTLLLNPIPRGSFTMPPPRMAPSPWATTPRPADRFASDNSVLVLSPLCWMKLMLFLHGGDTEVGGFGISRRGDLLYLEDFVSLRQRVTATSVAFDDAAVADHFDAQVDAGRTPPQFARVWVHTHPGESPEPSGTDEETFARVFGRCDWAIMFIVSRTGRTYCRLNFAAGPGGAMLLDVQVDWATWPQVLLANDGADLSGLFAAWMDEYGKNVFPVIPVPLIPTSRPYPRAWGEERLREDDFVPLDEGFGDSAWLDLLEVAGEVRS